MLCIEQNDEWLVGRAYLSPESMQAVLALEQQNSLHERSQEHRPITDKEKEVAQLQAA